MNHDCNGDIFTRHGKRWMQCFRDSTILPLEGEGPATCPNCDRPWRPVPVESRAFDPDTSIYVALQVDLPHYKERADLVDLLRGKLERTQNELHQRINGEAEADAECDKLEADLAAARAEVERLRAVRSTPAWCPAAGQSVVRCPGTALREELAALRAQSAAATRLMAEDSPWPLIDILDVIHKLGGVERARLAVELAEARDAAETAKNHGSFDEQAAAFKREAAAEKAWRARGEST